MHRKFLNLHDGLPHVMVERVSFIRSRLVRRVSLYQSISKRLLYLLLNIPVLDQSSNLRFLFLSLKIHLLYQFINKRPLFQSLNKHLLLLSLKIYLLFQFINKRFTSSTYAFSSNH